MALRIALLSTPRSGNTWLRSLLADVYEIPQLAIHNPADEDWATLPDECVIQIHWHRTPAFLRLLEEAGFRVITLLRHPLSVLLSILQFCPYEPATQRWLEGEGGNERPIYGAMPGSAAFAEYAVGPRAAALLSISVQWRTAPGACQVRYEDMVADPTGELERIGQAIGCSPRRPAAEATSLATMAGLRNRHRADHHFWQGRPDLWKMFLTARAAERIAQAHPDAFACGGYSCDADPDLTPGQADLNWVNLVGAQMADKLYNLTKTSRRLADAHGAVRELQQTVRESQEQKAALEHALQQIQDDLRQSQDTVRSAQAELQDVRQAYREAAAELHHFHQLGPMPLRIAWKLRDLSHRYPALSAAAKSVLVRSARLARLGKAIYALPRKWANRRLTLPFRRDPHSFSLNDNILRISQQRDMRENEGKRRAA